MQTLTLSLLGSFRARLDDQPIPHFYSTKTQALLTYLAVARGQSHARARLTGLLWPEFPQSDANRSLRQVLFQLNKTLDNRQNQILLASRQSIQFDPGSRHWLDVSEFLRKLKQGRLEEAIALYRGPFLDGFSVADSPSFEEWVLTTREELHRKAVNALLKLTGGAASRGDFPVAQAYATQILAQDPWQEQAHRDLMLALAMQGQRNAALAQYARCLRILDEELGSVPEAETVELYERIRSGNLSQPDRADEIRVTATTVRSISAPTPRTPLVGRESQLTQILARLADPHCRLLTLVGLGGVGKTRLALEAVQELSRTGDGANAFPDGIWFVPLLEAKTPEGAVGVVAQALGIPLFGDRTIVDQVLSYLRDKTLLLVLDNIEHLPGTAEPISALLDAAPGVKVLVTSQEALNLWDEWFFPIKGLAAPLPDVTDPDVLASSPAVALFALNARRRHADFVLANEMETVARICRLVAGMPLAIELAASWLTRLSCVQIADQIAADLDFLATSAARIPKRHRSIRAVLDTTWDLLSAEEQDALRRLSIFGGSFHPQAAQAVAGVSLSLLSRLLEKTLIQGATDRYQMHDMVRRYAEEKLLARPQEQVETLNLHSDFYLDFIAGRQEGLFQSSRQETIAEVAREFENVLSAWQWAADHGRFAQIDPAQESLFAFCLNRGRYDEAGRCFQRLVQALETAIESAIPEGYRVQKLERIRGRALARLGFFAVSGGEMEAGMEAMRQALAIARRHESPRDMAFCLTFLGEFEGWRGNFDLAQDLLNQSIQINEDVGDLFNGGFALYRLGELTHNLGDFEAARAIFQRCVAISRQTHSQDAMGYALDQLGYSHYLVGDLAGAEAAYQESLALFRATENELGMALAGTGLGIVAWARGGAELDQAELDQAELERAGDLLVESIRRARQVGHAVHLATSLSVLGLIELDRGYGELARSYLEEGLRLAQRLDFGRGIITCMNGLAQLCWERGDDIQARAYLTGGLELAMQSGVRSLQADVLYYWAHFRLAESRKVPDPDQGKQMAAQAGTLLALILRDLPVQHIFRQRAGEMLTHLTGHEAAPPTALPAASSPPGMVARLLRSDE